MGFFEWLSRPNVKRLEEDTDVEGLIRALGYEKSCEVRCEAADALGRIEDPRAIEPLIKVCEDKIHPVPGNAERALEKFWDDPRAKGMRIHIRILRDEERRGIRRNRDGSCACIG